MAEQTLYQQLGGKPAVDQAVEIFYQKMLSDERVSKFFDQTDMARQKGKQKAFLTMVFGGPVNYSGQDMRTAHQHLVHEQGLNEEHFDITVGHLADTLRELGVEEDKVQKVADIANSVRDEVLDL